QRAPRTQLIDTAAEKATLGESVLGIRELTLTPVQRFEAVEKVPKQADYIAIAGLFYAPAPMRWKYVFKVDDVEDSGIVLGAHACA
ncbi:type VI secretion system lipoprotein TssJ, partial [Paenibacillus polymyxa]|nr:type VI secretion system lipoprotein TssJ [Paenibacillus polymyxa]